MYRLTDSSSYSNNYIRFSSLKDQNNFSWNLYEYESNLLLVYEGDYYFYDLKSKFILITYKTFDEIKNIIINEYTDDIQDLIVDKLWR